MERCITTCPIYEALIPSVGTLPRGHSTGSLGPPGIHANIRLRKGTVAVLLPPAYAHVGKPFICFTLQGWAGAGRDVPAVAVTLRLTSFPAAPHSCPLPCSVVLFEHLYLTTVPLSSQHVHPPTPTTSCIGDFMRVP